MPSLEKEPYQPIKSSHDGFLPPRAEMKENRIKSISRFLLALMFIVALTACGSTESSSSNTEGKLKVVATTGQITDALANIAGDAIELKGLFGPGIDPHLYVPTEGDVSTFGGANAIFYNGLHLEAQMTRVMEQMEKRGITVVAVADTFPTERLLNWEANTPYDPHVWNNPELWSLGVEAMRDTLIEMEPDHAELYRQNTDAYLAQIKETDQYIREQIERIPPDKRVMITAHDAFGYFADRYGLEQKGLQGISTQSEASTADVQDLADFIVEHQIPALFVESSVPPHH
jgi:manganese/zinc/iron transport system substrate-binding protein